MLPSSLHHYTFHPYNFHTYLDPVYTLWRHLPTNQYIMLKKIRPFSSLSPRYEKTTAKMQGGQEVNDNHTNCAVYSVYSQALLTSGKLIRRIITRIKNSAQSRPYIFLFRRVCRVVTPHRGKSPRRINYNIYYFYLQHKMFIPHGINGRDQRHCCHDAPQDTFRVYPDSFAQWVHRPIPLAPGRH